MYPSWNVDAKKQTVNAYSLKKVHTVQETEVTDPLNSCYGPVNPHLPTITETYPASPPFFCFQKEYAHFGGPSILKDRECDILRRTILELLMKGSVHYTDLEKKVCATCHSFATTNTFKSQLHYLLSNDHIARIARGIYQITPKGKKYLALLTS